MKKKLLTLFLVMSFSIVLSVYYNTIVFSEQINYTEEQYNGFESISWTHFSRDG